MAQYDLSLKDYLRVVRKRKTIIVMSFLIFTGSTMLYLSNKPPVYEAATTVEIEERKRIAGLLTEWIIFSPGDLMETQAKTIRGFPVIKKVALRMGLITKDAPVSEVHRVVSMLKSKIRTERIARTNIITIIAVANEPEEAMSLANTVADAYIEDNLLEKNKQARTVRKFIEDQLASLEGRLNEAEDKMREFGDEVQNINIADDVRKKLVDLQLQLSTVLQKYTEKHPKVIRARDQLKEIEKQLKGFSGREVEYARLQREVEANRRIYAMLKEKLEEVRITEAEKIPDVSIIDPAGLPKSPVSYQLKFNLVLGGFLGLVVGMVAAFVAENLDTSFGAIGDVENVVKVPVLGIVPSIASDEGTFKRRFLRKKASKKQERDVRLVVHYKPTSPIAELFRNIKTNIKLSSSRKTILITSAGPEEGKTTILINLGLVCAQDGLKVLLISSDLRRPAIAGSFGLNRKPGLSELIMGTAVLDKALRNSSDMMLGEMAVEEILKRPGLERVWILPAGVSPLNPSEVLGSKELDNLIGKLKKDFDIILFDSPPVLPVSDATILAAKVDGVILCYEIGRTSRDALVRAKLQLESARANVLGIILNHIKPQTQVGDAYPYYRYRYYGRKKEEAID